MKQRWIGLAVCICMAVLARAVPAAAAEPAPADELVALAASAEEAQQLADDYGMELCSYACGVAVLRTEDAQAFLNDPQILQEDEHCFSENRIYEVLETGPAAAPQQDRDYQHSELRTEAAWQYTQGEGTLTAVIDTGIDTAHPEFAGRISPLSYNSHTDETGPEFVEDQHGHGTHVAGIIAGQADGIGVTGIAPRTELLVIKASRSSDGRFEMASLLRGINYAREQGADVINMSLGVTFANGENKAERKVITEAVNSGVTVICAAGNAADSHACYPAAYPETIAVSGTKAGAMYDGSYSNYGPEIDLGAPGTAILSAAKGGGYIQMTGTSMACPSVSGTAALLCALHPDFTPEQIRSTLCSTAMEAGLLGRDDQLGCGVVNAGAALAPTEQLVQVTYDPDLPDWQPVKKQVLREDRLAEPLPPPREGYQFMGWFDGENKFDFAGPVRQDLTLTALWASNANPTQGSVSGVVRSYNAGLPCSVRLVRGDVVWYSTMIPSGPGGGLHEQSFLLENVLAGSYQLEVHKAGQLTYVIRDLEIGTEPIDLTGEKGKPWQVIELLSGDVDQDGRINISDLNRLLNEANFGAAAGTAAEPLTDVNGDGTTDRMDLNYLWKNGVYNKSSKTDQTWSYQAE